MNFAWNRAWRTLLALVTTLGFAAPVCAQPMSAPQGSIVGLVVDAANGAPIPDVRIRIVGTKQETVTDGGGRFVLKSVAVGRYVLSLTRKDFQPAVEIAISSAAPRCWQRCPCIAATATSASLP